LGPRARDRILGLTTSVINGGACLRRPRALLAIATYSIVVWLLESGMFAFILPVFSLDASMVRAIVAMSVTNLGVLVPSTPGFVGPFHYFCSQAMMAQGVPQATALSYAVMVHLAFFAPVTLWGVGVMLWYGVQVGVTAAMARAARRSPELSSFRGVPVHVISRLDPVRASISTPDLYVALTEALVSDGDPSSLPNVRAAADFLALEVSALPTRLSVMFRLGTTAFRFWVRLRYVRSFCALDLGRRRAAVNAWAFGRFAPLRQLFRPVRSLVTLAYYEAALKRPATRASSHPRLHVVADAASGSHD
jgi:hypothetical protein